MKWPSILRAMTPASSRVLGQLNVRPLSHVPHPTVISPSTSTAMVSRPQRSQLQMNWVRYFVLAKSSHSRHEVKLPGLADLASGEKMER